MRKRDPGTAPKLGDRVPYVIIAAAKNTPAYLKVRNQVNAIFNTFLNVAHRPKIRFMCSSTVFPSTPSTTWKINCLSRWFEFLSLFSELKPNLHCCVSFPRGSIVLMTIYCTIFIINVSLDGDHTRTRSVVTSKVGGLAGFTTRKSTCVGCKTVLPDDSAVCK